MNAYSKRPLKSPSGFLKIPRPACLPHPRPKVRLRLPLLPRLSFNLVMKRSNHSFPILRIPRTSQSILSRIFRIHRDMPKTTNMISRTLDFSKTSTSQQQKVFHPVIFFLFLGVTSTSTRTHKTYDKLAEVYSASGDTVQFASNLQSFLDDHIPGFVWVFLLCLQILLGLLSIFIGKFNRFFG